MMKNPSIAFIDDDKDVNETYETYFDYIGFNVVGRSYDATTGVEMIKKYQPDFVILDTKMPIVGGEYVVKMLKKIGSRTRIIVISSLVDNDVSYNPNVIAVFTKPCSLRVVEDSIKDFLASRSSDSLDIQKNIVTFAVEKAVLELGPPDLEMVENLLKDDYNCEISDCLEHPEYLKRVLSDLFGKSCEDLLYAINKVIEDSDSHGEIEKFLLVLNTK